MTAGVNTKESERFSAVFAGNIHCPYMKSLYTAHSDVAYLLVHIVAIYDMTHTRVCVCVCVCVCVYICVVESGKWHDDEHNRSLGRVIHS
jgi:hypothetical protein